jgi:hypothetical protein
VGSADFITEGLTKSCKEGILEVLSVGNSVIAIVGSIEGISEG